MQKREKILSAVEKLLYFQSSIITEQECWKTILTFAAFSKRLYVQSSHENHITFADGLALKSRVRSNRKWPSERPNSSIYAKLVNQQAQFVEKRVMIIMFKCHGIQKVYRSDHTYGGVLCKNSLN